MKYIRISRKRAIYRSAEFVRIINEKCKFEGNKRFFQTAHKELCIAASNPDVKRHGIFEFADEVEAL